MDRICNDCGSPFIIDNVNRSFYEKRKIPFPCRCLRCRKIRRPQLWYVNGETLEVESVSWLRDSGKIRILYHGKLYNLSRGTLGIRLFKTYDEAWLAALLRKQARKKERRT